MATAGPKSAPAPLVGAPVGCASCGLLMQPGTIVRDVHVYKLDELAYIEIHHDVCPGTDRAKGRPR